MIMTAIGWILLALLVAAVVYRLRWDLRRGRQTRALMLQLREGKQMEQVRRYQAEHPDATVSEVLERGVGDEDR